VGEEEIKVALENLRGQLRRLDTVLKMSTAEQRRVNADLAAALERWGGQVESLDQRLDRLDTRLAAYTGGLFALWLLFQVVRTLLR
jgi:ferritin-like metal-binding protein YciE